MALTEEQRKKVEWASLIWIQSVVEQHRKSPFLLLLSFCSSAERRCVVLCCAADYFYRSDVQVLVDSLMRRSLDSGVDVVWLCSQLLLCRYFCPPL